ncbi:MAG: type I DNA topoisomerase [Holosporaceae bacterium]|jgi:DNA topoisomerase-1|nr:type I DNA topoisomerase [Holosporaceae bacterium]
MRLVVVESPAKAKTINKYLGSGYKVVASYGHIRDLLSKDGSVRPDDNFSMVWEVKSNGKKHLQDIATQLKTCDELLLATDPDREGEAISWHIKELLRENNKLKIPFKRIVFHEITKGAIKEAIANPRDIDSSLVDAYLARRALDYLVGFTISPILWRKLPGSKSAGRVQSVALRIIVDREQEIEAFQKKEYWSIEAKFEAKNKKLFAARLIVHEGKKLDKFSIVNAKDANSIKNSLLSQKFFVESVETKVVKRNPAPAFITSTLQQEASRKLGFSAKKTMQLAQNLYEGVDVNGETTALITYMRTDSVNLSREAIDKIRELILEKYGKDFLPEKPRFYQTKVKNAQEAHEAIRPVDSTITPDSLRGKINADLHKLYSLVWKRAVACQMSSAEFDQVQVDIADDRKNVFRANGSTLKFEGFIRVYVEGQDDQSEEEETEGLLPPLAKGDSTPMKNLEALQHFTTPPPRFSEASLVKKLEELGIGRPSTYATILQVLQDRGYAKLLKKLFIPEVRGRLVTSFLTNFFSRYLEYGFTADLEQSLDDISNGSKSKLEILKNFWKEFCENVAQTQDIKISDVIDKLNETLGEFLFRTEDGISRTCPECKSGELSLKMGRYGAFLGCSRYPDCGYIKKLDSSPTTESDGEIASSSEYPKFLGNDPVDGGEISLRKGPYGLYIQKDKKSESVKKKSEKEKPPRASIPNFINVANIDLNLALALLQFPKILGTLEGEEVKIGIGRFGPYVLFKGKYASAPKSTAIFDMTLDDAIALIKSKNK